MPEYPTCRHDTDKFQCSKLTMRNIKDFHTLFYNNKEKSQQNAFIARYCTVEPPGRKRQRNGSRKSKAMTTGYHVRVDEQVIIPVCKDTFLRVLQLKRTRVENIVKHVLRSGDIPKETRGGDHTSRKYLDKRDSVMKFISKFKCSKSHYCRSKTSRVYLPATLNIKKMWRMYNESAENDLQVKLHYFRYVFNRNFNIGFGSPLTDACCTCIEYAELLKREKDPQKKQEYLAKKQIHKKRAKAFYELLKEKPDETLTMSFDCQKNLPLPKVPDQEAYYRRQMYLYNFSVVAGSSQASLTRGNCYSFVWTEDLHKKGSNEIASCVYYALNDRNLDDKKKVRLFADGCGGQNKNSIVVGMCCCWLLQAPECVKGIELIFPIRGHSFLPPDRLFGLSESQFKKMEVIANPDEYIEELQKHATIVKVGETCEIFDWKKALPKVMKAPGDWHFKFAESKRYNIRRAKNCDKNVVVKGESVYKHEVGAFKFITKKKKFFSDIQPSVIQPKNSAVKPKKLGDVKRLLEIHYGATWADLPSLKYFKDIFETFPDIAAANLDDDVEEEILCEYLEECPELCI